MTYNFDPDLWYENQLSALEGRLAANQLTEEEFHKAKEELDQRYEEMLDRLDGTYELP